MIILWFEVRHVACIPMGAQRECPASPLTPLGCWERQIIMSPSPVDAGMTNTAGQIKAGTAMSPRRRRRPTRSETVTMADTTKVISAIRLTTDVITFAAIVVTIIVLVVGMIVAPFAIASWYPPNFSQISDNLRDRLGEAG